MLKQAVLTSLQTSCLDDMREHACLLIYKAPLCQLIDSKLELHALSLF